MKIQGFQGRYRFLSNFEPVPVVLDEVTYPSVEHAYCAAKTDILKLRETILKCPTAGEAKRIGRGIKLSSDWEDKKLEVMRDLLIQKFVQEPYRTKLLETGDAYIEETNTWNDTFWGVCEGVGENHLGFMLMEIRKWLREVRNDNIT